MAFSRKILQLFNGICNIMVSPNVRNLIFATIVSPFFQATHSILNSHALISTTHVRKNWCSWSKSRWSEQKVWFSQTLISNPRCYATGKGFLCLCTMQYKWPLFPIQLVFLRFSLHLQRDICVLNSGYANQTWLKTLFRISAMLIIGY